MQHVLSSQVHLWKYVLVYNYSFPAVIADEVPEARMRFELLVHPSREIRSRWQFPTTQNASSRCEKYTDRVFPVAIICGDDLEVVIDRESSACANLGVRRDREGICMKLAVGLMKAGAACSLWLYHQHNYMQLI